MIDESGEYESPPRAGNTVRSGVVLAIVAVVSFGLGVYVSQGKSEFLTSVPFIGSHFLDATPDEEADLTDFWRVWNALDERFVDTTASTTIPTREEKIYGAIKGLTESFGDPYTVFMPPVEAKIFQETISGNFEGVGMEIGSDPSTGILTVIAPLKGTPAERAGIKSGDLVISINGESTDGLSTDEAVQRIRGPKGTSVDLEILRDGELLEISVVRDAIEVPQVDDSLDPESNVYSIALYEFSGTSSRLFNEALARFHVSGATKLIIDLRGNPGGYLDSAVSIASHFLPKGTEIVTEDYEGKGENFVHRSTGTGDMIGVPTVVLMNKGSASASEILAGALRDNGAATVVGISSSGKGSVQELLDVGEGALKITVARWLTPSGKNISDGGIAPDIEVVLTEEDVVAGRDVQKARAIEFLVTGK